MKFDEKNYRSESWGGSTVEDVLKYKDWIRDFREAVDAHKILQPEAEKLLHLAQLKMPVLRVASEEYLDKEDAENSIYRYIYHGIRPMIPPRSLSVSHYLMRGIERQVTDTLKAANFGVGGFLTAEEEDLKRLLDERAHLLKGFRVKNAEEPSTPELSKPRRQRGNGVPTPEEITKEL
ncbi:hypothetical protein MMC14_008285 [Varicellaria rhodocarpa]|nr:hypothetical protein [Varicellaria rhodocarpa]